MTSDIIARIGILKSSYNSYADGIKQGMKEMLAWVEHEIDSFENFYPKDIFTWTNKNSKIISEGRFHQHCYEIVENTRSHIKEKLAKVREELE